MHCHLFGDYCHKSVFSRQNLQCCLVLLLCDPFQRQLKPDVLRHAACISKHHPRKRNLEHMLCGTSQTAVQQLHDLLVPPLNGLVIADVQRGARVDTNAPAHPTWISAVAVHIMAHQYNQVTSHHTHITHHAHITFTSHTHRTHITHTSHPHHTHITYTSHTHRAHMTRTSRAHHAHITHTSHTHWTLHTHTMDTSHTSHHIACASDTSHNAPDVSAMCV